MTMPCRTDAQTLGLRVAARTGGMSHEVVVFAVTNKSSFRCSIGGYPGVAFRGGTYTKLASGRLRVKKVHAVRADVHDGYVWNCPDGGQHRLVLAPGGSAYFAVGTATAYGGPELDVTAIRVQLPGASRVAPRTSWCSLMRPRAVPFRHRSPHCAQPPGRGCPNARSCRIRSALI